MDYDEMTSTNGHAAVPVAALQDLSTAPTVEEERVWLQGKIDRREARLREIDAFIAVALQQKLKTEVELVRLQRVQAILLEDLTPPVEEEPEEVFPPAPRPRTLTGQGTGYQTARYLLEVLQQRESALTLKQARLACKGWHSSTVHAGLKRLVEEGLVLRIRPGTYTLTDAGRAEGPAETLPLQEPVEPVVDLVEAAG